MTGRLSSLIVLPSGLKIIPEAAEQKINALEGVAESLIRQSKEQAEKVFCHVVLECKEENKQTEQMIKDLVYVQLMQICPSAARSIVVQNEPLERNQLGKLLRTKH